MAKNLSKIYRRAAFMILAIIVSSLLNICLFALQAKAAAPRLFAPKLDFTDNNYYGFDKACAADESHEARQSLGRPPAPMPQCCLARNRYYDAIVNTANDQSAQTFSNLTILPLDTQPIENYSTHYIARLTYPPPESLALASIVIRE